MAIVRLEPDSQVTNNTESIPEVLQKPSESLFTPLVPESKVNTLLAYVEGYPWSCNWYGQITSRDNTLEHYDPTTLNFTQPYYEVKDLVLHVNSPLSSSYETSNGVTTSTGSATVPYGLKPNVGDIFIAQLDEGSDAMFCVTTVERKTYRKDSLYDITYSLFGYIADLEVNITQLYERVQQTFFFNKDTNYFNRDHLITPTIKEANDRLKAFLMESQSYYLETFSNRRVGTIVLPGTTHTLYDPLLLKFLARFIDHDTKIAHPWFQFTWDDKYLSQRSLFDVVLARSPAMAQVVNKYFGFVPVAQLKNMARFGTLFHTPVDFVIYPKDPDTSSDVGADRTTPVTLFEEASVKLGELYDSELYVASGNNHSCDMVKMLPDLFEQDCYLVTPAFYDLLAGRELQAPVSFVEVLLARFIKREAIAREDLVKVSQTFYEWAPMHQLYILPLLWLMIKATI